MGVRTMKEATEGLTPKEVWIRRDVYHHVRRILIDPSTTWEWNPHGYLDRVEFSLYGTRYVLRSDEGDYPSIGAFLYLMFDSAARLIKIEEALDAEKAAKKKGVNRGRTSR